ncbi:unnamed protein product [Polarella glacialis]|uniref:Maspardin n=1 Tax=Polarella glacialis TaxID=89957 RepID=A0A813HJQ6_POLGL|nr:unnamed protein product [Polarella glacialis]
MPGGPGSGAYSDGNCAPNSCSVTSTSVKSIADDFATFKSDCPLQKFLQPRTELEWSYYQAGPASDNDTVVFLHGTSSTAAVFFYQVQAFGEKGYRAVSAQYPTFDCPDSWCKGFDLFLDALKCRTVHIVGAGLGGFLGQHFAAKYPNRVRSLALCNAFASTGAFADRAGTLGTMISLMPTSLLRQAVLDAFPQEGYMELSAKQAIDWVGQQVHQISGDDLGSRMSLNCTPSLVSPLRLDYSQIVILESSGETMVVFIQRGMMSQRNSGES